MYSSVVEQCEHHFVPDIETAVMHYQKGIQKAFDWLYLQFKDKIEDFARSKTLNQLDYEDLLDRLNQCFVVTANKYRGSGGFKNYFWTCAQNELNNYLNIVN